MAGLDPADTSVKGGYAPAGFSPGPQVQAAGAVDAAWHNETVEWLPSDQAAQAAEGDRQLPCNHLTAREVFRLLDDQLWTFTSHNPVLLLHLLTADRADALAVDSAFLAQYDAAIDAFDRTRSSAVC